LADYGYDISTFPDLDPTFSALSGTSAIAQAILRRLRTPRGTLEEDDDFGYDLTDLVNDDYTRENLNRWRREIADECLKDERVSFATVTITKQAGDTLLVSIGLVSADGPFDLVISLPDLTHELLIQ
jgi:phage baseplate assembly protein W